MSPTFLARAAQITVGTVRATHGKITVSGIPNCLYYFKIIIVYTQYINVAVGCIIQPGGLRVGDL